jgi:hypothetical protein
MTSLSRRFFHAAVPALSLDRGCLTATASLCILFQISSALKVAAQSQTGVANRGDCTRVPSNEVNTHAGAPVEAAVKPSRRAIIDMKASDTHLVDSNPTSEGRINRWFVLETASIGSQYRFSRTPKGAIAADQLQYQASFKGRFKFDSRGRLDLNASLSTGSNFRAGWNRTGWGSGRAQTNLFLKQLYLAARPVQGVELSYGGLDIARDESTDITNYSYEGYIMG